jgi:hypothetical protein
LTLQKKKKNYEKYQTHIDIRITTGRLRRRATLLVAKGEIDETNKI